MALRLLWYAVGATGVDDHTPVTRAQVSPYPYPNLICLEKRRPRQYGGMEGIVEIKKVADALQHFTMEEELRAARQILVGAVWSQ